MQYLASSHSLLIFILLMGFVDSHILLSFRCLFHLHYRVPHIFDYHTIIIKRYRTYILAVLVEILSDFIIFTLIKCLCLLKCSRGYKLFSASISHLIILIVELILIEIKEFWLNLSVSKHRQNWFNYWVSCLELNCSPSIFLTKIFCIRRHS